MALDIVISRSADIVVVELVGRATIGLGNDQLNLKLRQVVEGGAQKILVNLARTSQIDSSGVSTIVRTFVTLQRTGGTLKLLSPSGRVREVLEVTHLIGAIPTFDDEAVALASFQ